MKLTREALDDQRERVNHLTRRLDELSERRGSWSRRNDFVIPFEQAVDWATANLRTAHAAGYELGRREATPALEPKLEARMPTAMIWRPVLWQGVFDNIGYVLVQHGDEPRLWRVEPGDPIDFRTVTDPTPDLSQPSVGPPVPDWVVDAWLKRADGSWQAVRLDGCELVLRARL